MVSSSHQKFSKFRKYSKKCLERNFEVFLTWFLISESFFFLWLSASEMDSGNRVQTMIEAVYSQLGLLLLGSGCNTCSAHTTLMNYRTRERDIFRAFNLKCEIGMTKCGDRVLNSLVFNCISNNCTSVKFTAIVNKLSYWEAMKQRFWNNILIFNKSEIQN